MPNEFQLLDFLLRLSHRRSGLRVRVLCSRCSRPFRSCRLSMHWFGFHDLHSLPGTFVDVTLTVSGKRQSHHQIIAWKQVHTYTGGAGSPDASPFHIQLHHVIGFQSPAQESDMWPVRPSPCLLKVTVSGFLFHLPLWFEHKDREYDVVFTSPHIVLT